MTRGSYCLMPCGTHRQAHRRWMREGQTCGWAGRACGCRRQRPPPLQPSRSLASRRLCYSTALHAGLLFLHPQPPQAPVRALTSDLSRSFSTTASAGSAAGACCCSTDFWTAAASDCSAFWTGRAPGGLFGATNMLGGVPGAAWVFSKARECFDRGPAAGRRELGRLHRPAWRVGRGGNPGTQKEYSLLPLRDPAPLFNDQHLIQ